MVDTDNELEDIFVFRCNSDLYEKEVTNIKGTDWNSNSEDNIVEYRLKDGGSD